MVAQHGNPKNPANISSVLQGYASLVSSLRMFIADNPGDQADALRGSLQVAEDNAAAFIETLSDEDRFANLHIIADSLSARLIKLCPDAGAKKHNVYTSSVNNLCYWIEPGTFSLIARKGLSINGAHEALVTAAARFEACEAELVSLAISGWFTPHMSSELLGNRSLYNLNSTENLLKLFKYLVDLDHDMAAETLTEALNHDCQPLAVALLLCGVDPTHHGLRKKLSARSKGIIEQVASSHGLMALQKVHGDLEAQMAKLQAMYKGASGHISRKQ
jgi:hypothetical protein